MKADVQTASVREEASDTVVENDESPPVHVTFFPNYAAKTLEAKEMTLADLSNLILSTTASKKADLPWLKLATFGGERSDKGSLRHDKNMISISGIELDYDQEMLSFNDAVAGIERAKLAALIYTSPSYTETKPRWRILLPTSCDLLPEERNKLVARVNGLFEGSFSNETWTLSQGYFFGSVCDNPKHRAKVCAGDYVDQRDDLDTGAIGKQRKSKANDERRYASGFEAHLARLGDGEGLEGFHNPLRDAIASYAATHGAGFDRDALKAKLREAIERAPKSKPRPYLTSDEHLDNLIDSAVEKFGSEARPEDAAIAPAFSEEDLALQFAARHAANARYVAMWNKWLRFDGARWKFDETLATFELARKLCREVASKVNKQKDTKTIASSKTRAAVISLAREDRRLAATVDQWDADPWLLNTPDGVVDLRSGLRRGPQVSDYMTKITAAAPDETCPMPLWRAFLAKVTRGDGDYQAFLARVCGYSITGVTRDHALFFLHGGGGNGKGVFLNTIADIMGGYHRTASVETFTATNTDQHPTDLAMLRGARMVSATETEEGRRWNESKIKMMTGGDKISARFMRQDFFEYLPQFKLVISGNHKPGLRSVDEAIRRRLHLLPFTVKITAEEKDPELKAKLGKEWPGILAWMIAGCVAWQQQGLAPPQVVAEATDAYLQDEDVVQLWLDECCVMDPQQATVVGQLFLVWEAWAKSRGEYVGSSKRLAQKLRDKGFEGGRTKDGIVLRGLGLNLSKGRAQAEGEEPKWQGPPM